MELMSVRRRVLMGPGKKIDPSLMYQLRNAVLTVALSTGCHPLSVDRDVTFCFDTKMENLSVGDRCNLVQCVVEGNTRFIYQHYGDYFDCRFMGKRKYSYDGANNVGNISDRIKTVCRYNADSKTWTIRLGGMTEQVFTGVIFAATDDEMILKGSQKVPLTVYDISVYSRYLTDNEVDAYYSIT